MKSHESNPSPMLPRIEAFIVRRFRAGNYTAAQDIKALVGLKPASIGRLIAELLRTRAINFVGHACHAGRLDIYGHAALYAPYGTPLLPGAKEPERKEVKKKGSGVIAGRRYVGEFMPLVRRPDEFFRVTR